MNTFDCHSLCPELCQIYQQNKKQYIITNLSSLYPGLTLQEKALAASHPRKMLKAYQLSWTAESTCSKLYHTPRIDDISDACRHFVWSGLLVNEFGEVFALQVLNAHEQEPAQSSASKTMDLINNQHGITATSDLTKSKKFSRDMLLKEFQKYVRNGKIVILKHSTSRGER